MAIAERPEITEPLFFKLIENNDYGTRDILFDKAHNILTPATLKKTIEQWRFRMQSEDPDAFGGIGIRLAQVAKNIGDPELYEEATLRGRSIEEYPGLAYSVANVYLKSGKPEKALAKLPSGKACGYGNEWNELLIVIHKALGNSDEAIKEYLNMFERNASSITAKAYLEMIPKDERAKAQARLQNIVRNGDFKPLKKATFFAEMNQLDIAAEIVEMNSNSFVHEHNSRLLALIELLEPTYALAIIVLYRALLNSVLAKEIPKYYNRAAKYVQQLETWNKQITDWKTIPPHEA